MDIHDLRELFDRHERRDASLPGFRREAGTDTVRQLGLSGKGSMVLWSDLDDASADAAIEAELLYFQSLGQSFEWKVYSHDRPRDLRERLAAKGFSVGADESVMVLDLDEWKDSPRVTAGIELRRITGSEGLADMASVHSAVWDEDPTDQIQEFATLLRDHPAFMNAYVAYAGDRPVAACRINFPENSPFASLWGGSTLAEFRGRGIYSAMLRVRVDEARRRGYSYLTIDALPTSRPIVERRGFRLLCVSNPCTMVMVPPPVCPPVTSSPGTGSEAPRKAQRRKGRSSAP